MKRVLAAILCATVVFTSGGFSATAYAADPIDQQIQTVTQEDPTEDETLTNDDTGETEPGEDTQTGKENETGDQSQAPAENNTDDNTGDNGEVQPGTTPEVQPGTTPEVQPGDTPEEVKPEDPDVEEDANPEDVPEELEEDLEESELEALDPDSAVLLGTTPDNTPHNYSDYFTVDANGVLVLLDGVSLEDDPLVPAAAKVIPKGIFDKHHWKYIEFEEGSQLETIEAGAFEGNTAIVSIDIPKGVTKIEKQTFMGCTSLETVRFLGDVTEIGEYAFQGTKIESISSKTVKEVKDYAFFGCDDLSNVEFPALNTIGNYAFKDCKNLTDDSIFPMTLTSIGSYAFNGCGFVELKLQNHKIATIGNYCFQNNSKLVKVELPKTLEVVSQEVFSGCPRLEYVNFGPGVKEIRSSAFKDCEKLKDLSFENTYKFETKAFEGCKALTVITVRHNKSIDGNVVSIAEDAFPVKTGVTMKGFDVEVQDYAERKGYRFESLKPYHGISVALTGSADVKPSVQKATEGTVVTVKITPSSNYVLEKVTITQNTPTTVTISEIAANYQVFSFTMPDTDVTLDVKMKNKNDAVVGKLTGKLTYVEGKNYKPEHDLTYDLWKFKTTGLEAQFAITDDNGTTNPWLWTFATNNAKVATISTSGVVRAVGTGKATLTATLKSNTAKKITLTVQVVGTTNISMTSMPVSPEAYPDGDSSEDSRLIEEYRAAYDFKKNIESLRGTVYLEDIGGEQIPVVQFEKHIIDNNSKTFTVPFRAYSEGDVESHSVTSNWVSTDKNIATVAKASSTSNSNSVTIKKGAVGETLVTAYVLNAGQKTADAANTQSFIIRVVDVTPRLDNSTLNVDSNSKVGTELYIKTVYDREIVNNSLHIYTKAKDKSQIPCKELRVYYRGGYYIRVNDNYDPFARTYSGATQLFIGGDFKYSKGSFEIPITKLTVTNKALNPTIKTSGKVNLFYNSTAPAELAGKVTVTQSLTNIPVDKVELYPETLAANFNINKVDDKTFEITRTAAEMTKVNNKNVVSGYIYIYYNGYSSPVKKAITVPTCDTAPDYVLDVASATASVYKEGQEYKLHLVDKKTKKNVQSLATLDETVTNLGITGLGFTQATTYELFENLGSAAIKDAKATDTITLKVNGAPYNGKAVIYVRMSTWSRALNYTFTLKTTNALPTVKLSTGTVTLNKTYASQTATITATQNQTDAKLVGFDNITYRANAKQAPYFEALKENIEFSENGIFVRLPETTEEFSIPKGTYAFSVTPLITYNEGDEPVYAKAISFKVSVVQTNPTIKLGTTFKLNAVNPGTEVISNAYTIGNLPTGVTGQLNADDVRIDPASANVLPLSAIGSVEFNEKAVSATLKNSTNVTSNKGKSFKYKVSGLKVDCTTANGEVDSAEIPAFFITLQLTNKAPTISVKATGTINPIDADSRITLTASVGNIKTNITDISFYEIDVATNVAYELPGSGDSKGGKVYYSPHFNLTRSTNDKVAYLTVDNTDRVNNGKKYKVNVIYKLEATGDKPYTAQFMITPKQTLPKIKTDKTAATLYAGQSLTDRTIKVKIETTTNMDVTFDTPKLANPSASVDKAFKVTDFDPKTGIMTLKLVNPSALILNSTYTLNFDAKYANQAPNTTGSRFTLKVTVKK